MIVVGAGLIVNVSRGASLYRQSNRALDQYVRVSLVHRGASFMTYPGKLDPALDSIFVYFLRAQIPIAAAIGAGYGLYYTLEYYRKRPKPNFPQKSS